VLGISTRCAPEDYELDRAVRSLAALRVDAFALHREPSAGELRRLAGARVVAVFAETPVAGALLIVEGGPAGENRERSLEELCRRLHGLGRLALRTPPDAEHHPAPGEIALIAAELRHVGYWHDATRGGEAYLEAAGAHLFGASFHPLEVEDLVGLRTALPDRAPAIVDCPPTMSKEELREAVRRAQGYFRA